MIMSNLSNQVKVECHIGAFIGTDSSRGGGSLVNKIKGGTYTDEQFCSLSLEENQRVLKLRKEAKKKKKEKWKIAESKRR
jgi:hypothetical protein